MVCDPQLSWEKYWFWWYATSYLEQNIGSDGIQRKQIVYASSKIFVLMVYNTNNSREKNIGSDGMQCKQLSWDCFNLDQNIDFDGL